MAQSEINWKALYPKPVIDYTEESGKIILHVPKTKKKLMIKLIKYLNKELYKFLHLDTLGSYVWQQMDGNHSIQQIIQNIQQSFPEEKQLEERTMLFIQTLYKEGYIQLYQLNNESNL